MSFFLIPLSLELFSYPYLGMFICASVCKRNSFKFSVCQYVCKYWEFALSINIRIFLLLFSRGQLLILHYNKDNKIWSPALGQVMWKFRQRIILWYTTTYINENNINKGNQSWLNEFFQEVAACQGKENTWELKLRPHLIEWPFHIVVNTEVHITFYF